MFDNNLNTIETLQYSSQCSGAITPDRQILIEQNTYNFEPIGAVAQKVMPTSRCLASVTLKLAKILSVGSDIYVEIREHDSLTNDPRGFPKAPGGLGSTIIPPTSLSTVPNYSEIIIPLNILLSESNVTNKI